MTQSQRRVNPSQPIADMLIEAMHDHHEAINRRKDERYPYTVPARLGTVDASGSFQVAAELCSTDVSLGGMGLLSTMQIPVGTGFSLELRSGTDKAWRVAVRIAYCKPLLKGVWRVGATFDAP